MFKIDYQGIEQISKLITKALKQLKPFESKIDLKKLEEINTDIEKSVKDFEENDRKLKIGVIGQVKAGKSSFINSLLFNGADILPKAVTPKTANLTIIKYDRENSIEVEFISKEEFEEISKNADIDSEDEYVKVFREIKKAYHDSGIDINNYQKPLKEKFDSYSEFEGKLDEYAGEGGKFSAIVKHISLSINDERLKGIEIIDTPGMNDPVLSRTEKTREFLRSADVVFFLSECGQFLDTNDMSILVEQMPEKGVQSMVLLGSQLDSAIDDAGWNYESYEETIDSVRTELKERSDSVFEDFINRKDYPSNVKDILKSAFPPVFMSSMLNNFVIKDQYSMEENRIIESLNNMGKDDWGGFEFTMEIFKELANFEPIYEFFEKAAQNKELILQQKLENMVPNKKSRFVKILENYFSSVEIYKDKLEKGDVKKLEKQRASVDSQKNQIIGALSKISNKIKDDINNSKLDMVQSFRTGKADAHNINERTGTETHTSSIYVSDSKWYNPFSWGTGHTEKTTYTSTYKYCMASDAVEKLMEYADFCCARAEDNFNELLNRKKVKLSIKDSLLHVLQTDSQNFSHEYFKAIIEEAVNSLNIPVFKADISEVENTIVSNFSGEIRGASEISDFKLAVVDSINIIFERLTESVEKEINRIYLEIDQIKSTLFDSLTSQLSEDIERLKKELQNQQKELEDYNKLILIMNNLKSET
ncbi:MAG: dynamin family protein [Candidatus Muiribacteriota bacterium]